MDYSCRYNTATCNALSLCMYNGPVQPQAHSAGASDSVLQHMCQTAASGTVAIPMHARVSSRYCCSGLVLGTQAPVMTPNGAKFSFLFLLFRATWSSM